MLLIAPGTSDTWSEVFKCPSNQAKESHDVCDFTVKITKVRVMLQQAELTEVP
jgi:hypothetical protein